MSNVNAAVITPVLAAGSTVSPYLYSINITQRLCSSACSEGNVIFAPQFSVESVSSVGEGTYVATCRVQGLISYVPCGKTSCCGKSQPLSQTFTIPFSSTAAPTSVTIAPVGATVNTIATSPCQTCSRTLVSETPVSVTVATA